MRHQLLASLVLIGATAFADEQQLSLKGYSIGMPMADCPPESLSRSPYRGQVLCNLGPTTIANEKAPALSVMIADGAVTMVLVRLPARGRDANYQIRRAIEERYGAPSEARAHLNEFTWQRGTQVLRFDGWAGTLALGDRDATRRRFDQDAKKSAGDL